MASKRQKIGESHDTMLFDLLQAKDWYAAAEVVRRNPGLASAFTRISPLAVACRSGAPIECVQTILNAAPNLVRHVLDSRGTPLHEAIVCDNTGVDVIQVLLEVDENLGDDTTRAALLQDVDGFTPLHLLIRRRFQTHIQKDGEDTGLMQILELLVQSCPEAVIVPDMGEYEEPPIIYALKANMYAPSLGSEDETLARIERQINEMVACMLKYNPQASSRVFSGYRGRYTALHSAVFHGRYIDTIEMLLNAGEQNPAEQKAALLENTQGELPLHFCAMRGEQPRTVALISQNAPEAVAKRDASGLTPFHWLWIRFVSTLLSLDGSNRDGATVTLDAAADPPFETNQYNEFWTLEQGNFFSDLQLVRRMDPPIDFLRMRHIPPEMLEENTSIEFAQRAASLLHQTRDRQRQAEGSEDTRICWSHGEVVVSLFWNKVVSLLSAAQVIMDAKPIGDTVLVHTAFSAPCCVPGVALIASSLFSEELTFRDGRGRLPLHYAAVRPWHAWDWPRNDGLNEPTAARVLRKESLAALRTGLAVSGTEALRVADNDHRLVLHLIIESFVRCCSLAVRAASDESICEDMLSLLREVVGSYPESLQVLDGITRLYPFMQAAAVATDHADRIQNSELPLSISFQLLRDNPTLIFPQTRPL